MLRRLLLCLCLLVSPAMAEEKLTREELSTLMLQVEAILGVSGDYGRNLQMAEDLYGLVVQDFGPETREAVDVERLIVTATIAIGQSDRALGLAHQMMEKAIRLVSGDDPLGYRCAAAYGAALRVNGEFEAALGFLSEALSEADKNLAPDDQAIVEILLVQAAAAQAAGRIDVADAAYQRLETMLKPRSDDQGKAMRAMALQGYARLVADYGDPEAAIAVAQAAIEALDAQFASLPNPHMMPLRLAALVELAELLAANGRKPEAVALVSPEMQAVAEFYGPDSPFWADLAFVQVVAQSDDDPTVQVPPEHLETLGRVVAIMEAAYDPLTVDLQRARLNYAVLLAAAGQGAEALAQLEKLEGRTEVGERSQVVFILYSLMSQGVITEDRAVEAALRWLQEGQSGGAAAAQRLLSARIAAGSGRDAAFLRQRTDLKGKISSTRDQLASYMTRPLAERDPADVQALRDAVRGYEEEQTALSERIAREAPKLAEAFLPKPLGLAEIRRRLGPDAALVVIDPPRHPTDPGLVVAVSAEAVDWHTFQAPGDQIEAAIASLRQGIDLKLGVRSAAALDEAPAVPDQGFDLDAAHFLYGQTFGQVAGVLAGKALLYVDLRGAMSALPPQLLVVAPPQSDDLSQADWLVRHHAISILPALSGLPLPEASLPPPPATLVAFADPDFADLGAMAPTALRGSLSPLPETADEARDVAQALGAGADAVRLGQGASEAALKSTPLGEVGTLYFATHGLVSGDQVGEGQALEEPALALTAGGGEDGFLTASEIAELHLNAGLVVLSACNTAVGDRPGADSLSGLAQSFLYAGARGLMVSHWPVESRSAVALMTDLFRLHADQPKAPLALAQQAAMLNMIDHPANVRWSHPAYWAPFVVVGNPD